MAVKAKRNAPRKPAKPRPRPKADPAPDPESREREDDQADDSEDDDDQDEELDQGEDDDDEEQVEDDGRNERDHKNGLRLAAAVALTVGIFFILQRRRSPAQAPDPAPAAGPLRAEDYFRKAR